VWNQWNNLSLADIVIAILLIGVVGLMLDRALGAVARLVAWQE
jgi:nitrate/nitrite transport system permease protein